VNIGDIWLVAHEGSVEVWAVVDGTWRRAIGPTTVGPSSEVSECVNAEFANEWPVVEHLAKDPS
jgi:hypothetical protein